MDGAPVRPELVEGLHTPVRPELVEGLHTPVCPELVEGPITPVRPELVEGPVTPVRAELVEPVTPVRPELVEGLHAGAQGFDKLSPNGVKLNPNGVDLNPNGVKLSPNGVTLSPNRLKLNPTGVKLSPNGVQLRPPNGGWRFLDRIVPRGDLLREKLYRRLWLSILISSFGSQITMLALPLTAAVLLHATPTQMGLLTTMEILPFVMFSLPTGVWLDRVRKLPVYVAGELAVAAVLASVPAVWMLDRLTIGYMYGVGFVIGCVVVTSGTAAQIVLTQVVPRSRLVEAHAKNALAGSAAEVAGPGVAGALIRLVGAPVSLLANAVLLIASVFILRGLRINDTPGDKVPGRFWDALREGLKFVWGMRLLVVLAMVVGIWQMCHQSAMVVQILFATRELGLNERQVGLCYVGLGVGTVAAGALGNRISRRVGTGPCLLWGFAICGMGWLQLAFAPVNAWGVLSFVVMLVCFGLGAVLIFINFLALRQAVTPESLLGRMTSTMRWLILLPAAPGALLGGWLGEHLGLRWALAAGGIGALALAVAGWKLTHLRDLRELPDQAKNG